MIKIDNLKKQFGETCACDIPSFQINDGDILGLVGNNGAGKTTLFRMLLDLLKADEGSVEYVFTNTSDGEASEITTINPVESEAWKRNVGAYIDEGFLIDYLSAGNKMKVGIISALLRRPATVILDEPFNFLDPTSQLVLKHLLTDYNRETGATILISSHNLQHTVDISTRIALLEHGVIIRDLPNSEGSARTELEEYFSEGSVVNDEQKS